MRRGEVGAAAVLLALSLARGAGAAVQDPGCGRFEIVVRAATPLYRLPHAFLRPGSDSAWVRSRPWKRGTDYVLDATRGVLRVLGDPVPGDTIHVAACWLIDPPPLELQLNRYRPAPGVAAESAGVAPAEAAAPVRPVTRHDPSTAPAGAQLALSGNKTIAVDFGSNQDAFLRQSLDLAVSGTLAPGVELTGVLSDRNTPLTASGTTQDLQALDRVLIELKAPQGGASLGDVPLELTQGEFARLDRRLQGVRGEWSIGSFQATAAAATAPGEYHRLQLFGIEGQQGPYLLTDRDGGLGVSVVAGSEVVTVDGERMTRGESADYSIDYERARITFTNRRPITSATRITVEYQYTLNRYRRSLVAAGSRWQQGALSAFFQGMSEGDDRGRPLDTVLDPSDKVRLRAAGDSAVRAIGAGVAGGGGDYDTVRVAQGLAFAYAGPDSGQFTVQFARVGAGEGEYADSTIVAGRSVYRFVGAGNGAYRVGRSLPLPEAHQLLAVGGGVRLGVAALELEGAASRLDHNTFSSLDDRDDLGGAGRATLRLEGKLPGSRAAVSSVLQARLIGDRFAPFVALERPFAEEDWGLAPGTSLDHQRRVDWTGSLRPAGGGELAARAGRLSIPGGFTSVRRELEWSRDGLFSTHALVSRSEGTGRGLRFADGGRERARLDLRLRLPWIEPALLAESDQRRFPSDTGRVGERFREAGLELASGRAVPWRLVAGHTVRRDSRAAPGGFLDRGLARTTRVSLEGPAERRLTLGLSYQHREVEPLADLSRSRSDLGNLSMRVEDPSRGLGGQMHLEVTAEGENRRVRKLTRVGAGLGAYDSLGNYLGHGDYDLALVVSPELDRVERAALSTLMTWRFGSSEAWRGSRIEFDFESDARRRDKLRLGDPVVPPGAVFTDPGLTRGSVLQRLEVELAPGSRASNLRARAERRVTADRTFENFSQALDDRSLTLTWRTRPLGVLSTALEGRSRRQIAAQTVLQGAALRRALGESGVRGEVVYTPHSRLRAAAEIDASWDRLEGQIEATRTVRLGPDVGVQVGSGGHLEVSARRAFVGGAAPVGLLPTADPIGPPRWEASTHLDHRVRESATLGLSFTVTDRPGRRTQSTGRAELRAYF